MKEIKRGHLFELQLIKQLLESKGVHAVIMDEHIGGLYNGLADIFPRIMVSDDDAIRALEIIRQAESEET